MSAPGPTYDVIIIGSGAGGGTLARRLAGSRRRILLLERGDWLPREPQNWDTAEVPYPFPPVSHEPSIRQLCDDLAAAGHHPFHSPIGIMLNEANMPYSTCVRCSSGDGLPAWCTPRPTPT